MKSILLYKPSKSLTQCLESTENFLVSIHFHFMSRLFDDEKAALLQRLHSGIDYSPKGSVDAPIIELVNFINSLQNYVTTSSCSGRISLYESSSDDESKGVHWIYVKHGLVKDKVIEKRVQMCIEAKSIESSASSSSTITLKCEPMILHIQCRCHESAQQLHQLAMGCGFRESGLSLGKKKTMLAIRTTSNTLEIPITRSQQLLISTSYLNLIIFESNKKLLRNFARIDKLISAMKEQFQWPRFIIRTEPSGIATDRKHNRWGHTSVITSLGTLTIGGSGLHAASTNSATGPSARQGLPSVCHSRSGCDSDTSGLQTIFSETIHGSSVILILNKKSADSGSFVKVEILLEYGGRVAPLNLQHRFKLTALGKQDTHSSTNLVWNEKGDIPTPRWGHSLTQLSSRSCLLLGGRDETQVLADCYLLHCEFVSDIEVMCVWTKISLTMKYDASPQGRFFHAAVALSWYRDELSTIVSQSTELTASVYGDDEQAANAPTQAVLIHGGISGLEGPTSVHQSCIIFPFRSSTSSVTWGEEVLHLCNAELLDLPTIITRFGHTLSDIWNRSLLLVGGTSSHNSTSSYSTVLDLSINERNEIIYGRVSSCLGSMEGNNDINSESNIDQLMLCAKCRVHHTAIICEPMKCINGPKSVHLYGGGSQCLTFGTHFCSDVILDVIYGSNREQIIDRKRTGEKDQEIDSSHVHNKEDAVAAPEPVLYIKKDRVKKVKVWLEQNGFIDKSRRISDAQTDAFQQSTTVSLAASIDSSNNEGIQLLPSAIGLVGPLPDDQTEDISLWMAVPITVQFQAQLLSISTEIKTISSMLMQELATIAGTTSLRVGVQESRVNKTLLTDGYRRASNFLDQFAIRSGLSAKAKGSYPSKYELVGDVLMIPEGAFDGQDWRFLGLNHSEDQSNDLDSHGAINTKDQNIIVNNKQVTNFWRDLANCFSVQRVARKARIHHGPKRESQVSLLYPPRIDSESSPDTGPGSRCWVTVTENSIAFSFDITRVMFCSGNVTERMRMARVKATDQVIVDMYAGVGYYTLPFLVYGGAKHVHACEWNPNSILALRENLRQNHVSDRCTVYPGDNALTTPQLINCADRICLGLLPSSTKSWPLAVQIAKPTGVVMIHVHENVNDVDIDQWKLDAREQFEALFLQTGKPFQVEITWLERVKSYAPHVYHVVLDLRCTSRI